MPEPPLGDYLGDFKNELPPDDYIVEFASGGPKNYGYKTHKGKEDCKVRGITLNSLGQRHVNFEILKNNVLEDLTSPLESGEARVTAVPIPYKIVRNAQEYQLSTTAQQKKYKLVYNKRVVKCSLLSNSYSDGHLASSHLFFQKNKKQKSKKKQKKNCK